MALDFIRTAQVKRTPQRMDRETPGGEAVYPARAETVRKKMSAGSRMASREKKNRTGEESTRSMKNAVSSLVWMRVWRERANSIPAATTVPSVNAKASARAVSTEVEQQTQD
jgi:hypothetical protein